MNRSLLSVALAALLLPFFSGSHGGPGESVDLPGLPEPLTWLVPPLEWRVEDGRLAVKAPACTDLFRDPTGKVVIDNSPRAMFSPEGPFLLSVRVEVDFRSDFDAGVLMVYADEGAWAKLCFEYSPQKEPTVVTVVNDGLSDDCNHEALPSNRVFLRIARLEQNVYAFHYSRDGLRWRLARYFRLKSTAVPRVGFSAQSPTGVGCMVEFSQIRYEPRRLEDLRGGS